MVLWTDNYNMWFKYCFVFAHLPHDFHVTGGFLVKKKGDAQELPQIHQEGYRKMIMN